MTDSDKSRPAFKMRDEEQALLINRMHWTAWIGETAVPLIGLAVAITLDIITHHHYLWLVYFGVALSCVAFVGRVLQVRASQLVVTNERVILLRGIFNKSRTEIPLDRIFNVSVQQTLLGKVFNFGALNMQYPGSNPKPLPHITNPFDVQEAIYEATEALQVQDAARGRQDQFPGAAAPRETRDDSLLDQLERLASLRERGHLSAEEFTNAKRVLITDETTIDLSADDWTAEIDPWNRISDKPQHRQR